MKVLASLSAAALVLSGCAGMGPAFFSEAEVQALSGKIRPGMTMEQVRQELGNPYDSQRYPNLGESVLSWFYLEHGPRHMFFNAHFDASTNLLKYTSRTPDPAWIESTQGGEGGDLP
jgi:outer membrane protein assembly factor BamE (lipoprotein component of BamABCDE complex)